MVSEAAIGSSYRKVTFIMRMKKIMRIRQNGPPEKFLQFLFTCSSVFSCIVMYGVIKIYAVQIYATSAWLA